MPTTSEQSWSQEAWTRSLPVYERILQLPFLQRLAEGTLPRACFNHYIGQDALYLNEYSRVLAHIASRVPSPELMDTFLRFARDGVMVEKSLHALFVDGTPDQMSDTCLHYTSLLKAQALEDVAVECAAILPCFWIYREVGRHIIAAARMEGNPYAAWIRTYADEGFDASTNLAIDICDRLAAEAPAETRRRMTEVFYQASRMEEAFWQAPMQFADR